MIDAGPVGIAPVPTSGPRMFCARCGIVCADARPNWKSIEHKARADMGLSADKKRALTMLALSPLGSTESVMLAHDFSVEMLAELARDGLVTAETETIRAGRQPIKITACGSLMQDGRHLPRRSSDFAQPALAANGSIRATLAAMIGTAV